MERQNRRSWALVPVVSVWLLRGVDLQHSDLVVQQTLVQVRRQPAAFPGDLLADAAASHPGLWLDLLALLPTPPGVLGLWGMLASLAAALLMMWLVEKEGGSTLAVALAGVGVLLPRWLPGMVEVLPMAPVSRTMALPMFLWAWWLAGRGRSEWAGLVAGLAVGIHPAVGGGGAVLAAVRSPRPLRTLGLAGVSAVPVLLPSLWLGLGAAFDESWWTVAASRWDHHLAGGDPWTRLAWLLLAAVFLEGAWRDRAQRPMWVASALVWCAAPLLALGTMSSVLPPPVARLHPWHWCVAPLCWAGVRTLSRPVVLPVDGLRWGVVLVAGVVGPVVAWRGPPPPLPEAVLHQLGTAPADRPVLLDPRRTPWVRLQTGRAVVASVKDGAEVIASPLFAERWSRRMATSCGLDAPPTGSAPGWTRYRSACAWPPESDALQALLVGYMPALVVLPDGEGPPGWRALAHDGQGSWYAPP